MRATQKDGQSPCRQRVVGRVDAGTPVEMIAPDAAVQHVVTATAAQAVDDRIADQRIGIGAADGVLDHDALVDGNTVLKVLEIGHRAAAGVAAVEHAGGAQVDDHRSGRDGYRRGRDRVGAAGIPDALVTDVRRREQVIGIIAAVIVGVCAVFRLQRSDIDRHWRFVVAVAIVDQLRRVPARPAVIVAHGGVDGLVLVTVTGVIVWVGNPHHHGRGAAVVEGVRQAEPVAKFVDQGRKADATGLQHASGGTRPASRVGGKHADAGIGFTGRVHEAQGFALVAGTGETGDCHQLEIGFPCEIGAHESQVQRVGVGLQRCHRLAGLVSVPADRCFAVIGLARIGEIDMDHAAGDVELRTPVDRVGKQRPRPVRGAHGIVAIRLLALRPADLHVIGAGRRGLEGQMQGPGAAVIDGKQVA